VVVAAVMVDGVIVVVFMVLCLRSFIKISIL